MHACGFCTTKIENLSVRFGDTMVLDRINLNLHCGELTAVIGPNGAGKSTLFKALLGLIPFSGSIEFMNKNGEVKARPRTGYVPQYLDIDRMAPISVKDVCAACFSRRPVFLPVSRRVNQKVDDCLSETGMQNLKNRRLGALSGGELQRVLLSLAVTPMPELLLLDEPVSGVDISGMQAFYESVRKLRNEKDLTIILISHDFDAVSRFADRVILLHHKIIADGPPSQVLSGSAFTNLFGFRWGIGGARG